MSTVSVIVPVRNGAATLADALSSILKHDCVADIIVVDDGSTDTSAAVAQKMGDSRIRVVPGPCTGISGAFNAGLKAARTEYVVRCDADDQITPGSLAPKIAWLDAHPDYVAASSAFAVMTSRGRYLVDLADQGIPREVSDCLRGGQAITHFGSWLTRREALIRIGGARDWFVTAEDIDLQCRLAEEGRVWHDVRVSYLYRLHGASITHTQTNKERAFYETAARDFARQRRNGEMDALAAGRPPIFSPSVSRSETSMPVGQHAAGLLTGVAWRRFSEGHRCLAIRLMVRALRIDPLSFSRWKGLMKIALIRGRN